MTALDDRLVPKALELIDRFGLTATLTAPSGTYIPGAGVKTAGTPAPFQRKVTPPFPAEKSWATGSLIQEGRALLFVAASGLAEDPTTGWEVIIGADTWRCVRANAIRSGELVAVWEMELER